jgi:septal ring factor EnvC (AmiA/AmiB activator)
MMKESKTEAKQQCKQLNEELKPLKKEHATVAEAKKELEIRCKALNQQTQKLE